MTNNERQRMNERRRASHARRIRALVKQHSLPPVSNQQRERMLDALDNVRGDGLTDGDLRVVIKLTTRGLFR